MLKKFTFLIRYSLDRYAEAFFDNGFFHAFVIKSITVWEKTDGLTEAVDPPREKNEEMRWKIIFAPT